MKKSWFVYVIKLSDKYMRIQRDSLMNILLERGVECAAYFPSIHLQPLYRKLFGFKDGDFPKCEQIADRVMAIPFHGNMTDEEINYVVQQVQKGLTKIYF